MGAEESSTARPQSGLRRPPAVLLAALAAGLAARLWYFADLSRQPFFGYPIVDALTYERLAGAIREGTATGGFFRPPLYPHFLAVIETIFPGPAAVPLLQFLLGLSAAAPTYFLARRWAGAGTAAAAAWIVALYPLRIFFEGEHLAVTLAGTLLAWGLWLWWEGAAGGGRPRALLAGLLLGAAALARPNLILVAPFFAAGAWHALGRRAGGGLLAAAAGALLAVAPVTLHNYAAEGRLIPVAANGGVNFYLGNRAAATGETPLPPGLTWQATVQEPLREGIVSLAGQDRYWWRRGSAAIREDPLRWARLLGRKLRLFWSAPESSNNKDLDYFTSVSFPVRHYRGWFALLVSLTAAAFVCARSPGVVFALWTEAGFGAAVALFFVTARYRLPLVPLLAITAAAGGAGLVTALREGRYARAAAGAALAAAVALAVFPGCSRRDERISRDYQLGQVYLMRGEPGHALACLERAAAARPGDPDVLNSLGAARFMRGEYGEAAEAYRRALMLGEFSEVNCNLAIVSEREGEIDAAIRACRRALEINPLERRAAAKLEELKKK